MVSGMVKNGVNERVAKKIWEYILPFARYGFNRAHAACYGRVAYQTAYMKANYPIQYMTAVLIAESGDMNKVPAIIHECGKMGISVLSPDVNHSFKNFAMIEPEDGTKTHIRFGLSGIKNVGENISLLDIISSTLSFVRNSPSGTSSLLG